MSYPTHDTDWAMARSGNYWRRLNGIFLLVGEKKSGSGFWARRGDDFVNGNFSSLSSAMYGAETGSRETDNSPCFDDDWEDA